MAGAKYICAVTLDAVSAKWPDSGLHGRVAGPRDQCPATQPSDLVELVAGEAHHRLLLP